MNKIKKIVCGLVLLIGFLPATPAQYPGWQHSGSLCILTTPEGANLPDTALEHDFPLLVRLDKDWFDFSQAKPSGEDVRFASADGTPLACQIDEWDAAAGVASIWVRIPAIKGNARQKIRMFWGKAGAAGESNGKAVFNESNGYLCVFHMSDPVKDDAGGLEARDGGTTASTGVIGKSRRFSPGRGINCGENITTFPTGSSPHSSEVWFKTETANTHPLAWGNEQRQGKVTMIFASPPHLRMDCYFSSGNVESKSPLAMSRWIHVVHTFKEGESRLYVNGVLDGENNNGSPLDVRSPARMYIGGWYDNYRFAGDIDEVRISKVTRSADWVKLQYENQKPLQTVVGPLVQPGAEFSVSEEKLALPEGRSAAVSAKAGGAQKVYWILKRGDKETIAAVDRFHFSLDAGRVAGDEALTLQFKAVYADAVKTKDIPVLIREDIPEPVFTLKAPAKWDGRKTIEVRAQISNLKAMEARGEGELKYAWAVSGMAVIKEAASGKLILKRSQNSGLMTVFATVSNGGRPVTRSIQIAVKEPAKDAWVERIPDKDEKPEDGQFYARDDKNEGSLFYQGNLSNAADSVFLRVYADDQLVKTESQKLKADKTYAFSVKLKPGLIKYKVEFGTKTGGVETVARTVTNLVCGDAYLIDGQSNALATDTGEKSPPDTSEWIRSYGHPDGEKNGPRQNLWCSPVWKAEKGENAELGWWGMELARRLLVSQKVPIFIINGAAGGTRIDQHQRNESHHTDLSTIYGRMLWRVRQARLTHGIRAILWHQGENDQGSDGPTGGYGWQSYQQYFIDMSAAWKQDFPNLRHYYLYQIWPDACSMGNGHGDMLREVQRTLPRLYSNMDVMSTLGIKPPGGCHYPLAGWTEFARLIQPLIERDFYGRKVVAPVTAPNLARACFVGEGRDTIALEFDQPIVWKDVLAAEFYLDGEKGKVASGGISGNVVLLKLKEASAARKISYLKELSWSQDRLMVGSNGIAALTFCEVPIASSPNH